MKVAIIMKNNNNPTLLSTLKNLFSQLNRLAIVFTQVRLSSLQRMFKPQDKLDVTSLLNKQVDDLAARAAKDNIVAVKISLKEHQAMLAQNNIQITDYQEIQVKNTSGIESEFAKYIKTRKYSYISHPHMGEDLKASAWEHIHTTIRHARNGAVDTAKLHASIAGSALEEAGHYMSIEDYTELVFEIEHYFTEAHK